MIMCKWTPIDPEKREKLNRKRSERKVYLDPKIMTAEEKRPFKFELRSEFEDGDIDRILTES